MADFDDNQEPNIMEQGHKVEFGYFAKRKAQFATQLQDGFARGFGKENISSIDGDKKPRKKRETSAAPTSSKAASGSADNAPFGGGPKDLSKLPDGLRKYWEAKRAGK